LIVVFIMV